MNSIELFAGIGGIALAAEWAGVNTVAFCEREPFCQNILNKRWPDVPIFDDVRTLTKESLIERGVDVGTIELISGGFPCQPFSQTGKQKGREDDRDLWPEMFRIIRELQPAWVVGENVANFAGMELERTLTDLESEGYETQSFIIPACGVEANHERKRTFILAYSHSFEKRTREKLKQSEGDTTRERISYSGSLESPGVMARKDQERTYDGRRDWSVEPSVGRMVNGIPGRMDRLAALGNAVVPQQIYPIFKAIMDSHKETK